MKPSSNIVNVFLLGGGGGGEVLWCRGTGSVQTITKLIV